MRANLASNTLMGDEINMPDEINMSDEIINGFIQELYATLQKLEFYDMERGKGTAAFRIPLLETKKSLIWQIASELRNLPRDKAQEIRERIYREVSIRIPEVKL